MAAASPNRHRRKHSLHPRNLTARNDGDPEIAYLIDVRSEEEYAAGHIPGSINVPGGQAVQRADDFVAVRNAPVVFISNDAARAVMTAYWYGQMGFPNVAVLEGGLNKWSGQRCKRSKAAVERGHRSDLKRSQLRCGPSAVDALRLSLEQCLRRCSFSTSARAWNTRAAHIPGAKWVSRGWVDIKLPELCPNRAQADCVDLRGRLAVDFCCAGAQ